VGNNGYEKLYGSYGLTTLKNNHVNVRGDSITFSFKGKKGVYHKISIRNKRFARIIKQCKTIPGRELFQYYDAEGTLRKVDSGQVNQYIKEASGHDFTTKDFRTWAGTLAMLRALREAPKSESLSELKKVVNESLQAVSRKLGNTVSVCRKYYVHPELIALFLNRQLDAHFEKAPAPSAKGNLLNEDEVLLIKLLKLVQDEQIKPTVTTKLLKASIQKVKKARTRSLRAA